MDYEFLTLSLSITKSGTIFNLKATQRLHKKYNIGHYSGYIENSDGHILDCFNSTNAPKDPITNDTLITHLNRFLER